jgi:hypothetical protein
MGRRDRARPDHVGTLTRIAPLVGATQVANTSAPPAVSTLDERGSMKWQLIVAGAWTAVFGMLFLAGTAWAELRILNDPGGEVSSYLRTFYEMRASGERIVIDGPCLSACTLLTGIVPRDHVCVTNRAVLGFHAASYYNDVSRSLVPTRAGTRLVMRLYPPEIRAWINQHGGLSPQLITMRGRDLAAFYPPCH